MIPLSRNHAPRSCRSARVGRGRVVAATVAFAVLASAALPAAAADELVYRWSLRGITRIAGLVMPSHGRGELRTRDVGGGFVTELEITSPESKKGEYFLYGSETRADGTIAEAWSSYRWRDEEKSRRERVEKPDVVDVAAGIRVIRERSPQSRMRMRIWSDGKVYPVSVERVGSTEVKVPAGTYRADHYRVRGVRVSGERFWKGGLDLWLAQDEVRTPVAIQVERGFANVRLELMPSSQASRGR
jgi:hypothetical protein